MYFHDYCHILSKLYISLTYHVDYFYQHQHWALFQLEQMCQYNYKVLCNISSPSLHWSGVYFLTLFGLIFYIFLKSFGLNNQRSSPFIVGIKDVITIFAKPDFLSIILGSLSPSWSNIRSPIISLR
jgi:hypothetical protein